MIPSFLLPFIKPGTEGFIERYSKSSAHAFRMVAEDRIRNLFVAGETLEAKRIGEELIDAYPDGRDVVKDILCRLKIGGGL